MKTTEAALEDIVPVVLVGGASRRFGRDKLRERTGGVMLIQRPIRVLREAFGHPVLGIGACHADVAALFDTVIPDDHPGSGPIGGIIAALRHCDTSIFVLAGDLLEIDAPTVGEIVSAAREHPHSAAVLGHSTRLEPCIGLYRPNALEPLLAQVKRGRRSLHDALPANVVTEVPITPNAVRNVNRPEDLAP